MVDAVRQRQRLILALSAYAVIAMAAWFALPVKFYVERFGYVPMSVPVILLMVLLAFKSIVHRNEMLRDGVNDDENEG
jgi:hypothetical protein